MVCLPRLILFVLYCVLYIRVILYNTYVRLCLKEFFGTTLRQYSYFKGVHMLTREKRVKKLVLRHVHTKWMTPNKCCGIFFVHWSASKENIIVSFHHSYDYCVSYTMIRIYKILHIYLQVSKTENCIE